MNWFAGMKPNDIGYTGAMTHLGVIVVMGIACPFHNKALKA